MHPRPDSHTLQAAVSRRAMGGFFVSGLLMAFPGAFFPAWGYHLTSNFQAVGNYFLSMNLGMLASTRLALWLLPRRGISKILALACVLAFASLIGLGLASPPAPLIYRALAFFGIGMGAGLLNTSVFHAISPMFRHNPAATVNLSGSFFGLGCLTSTLLIAGAFGIYTVPSMLILFALIPLYFGIVFWRSDFPVDTLTRPRSARQVSMDFRSASAILFSLLLFFQFGNEWSIAGWLVLFLIQRLGLSPTTSLLVLSMYWLALLLGRIIAQTLLPRVRHTRLLTANVLAAMLGCMLLAFTNNLFGACLGVLMVGFGFASIYPLIVEKIGARFPSYHPGFFNGVFSFALSGGLLAPWLLSFLAHAYGIQIVMALPMLGTIAVFLCLVGIWVEGKLSGRGLSQPEGG
ncbi:MAG: MFS transporter [Bryobacteraceae bacterium]